MICHKDSCEINIDSVAILLGTIYIILPVIIFMFGWVKLFYSLPISVFLLFFMYVVWRDLHSININQIDILRHDSIKFWLIIFVVLAIWVYLSGIGGMVWQNADHVGRNSTFRDLSTQPWPIIIDLSKENATVRQVCGSGKVGYSYYFCWWLPVALLSKCFSLNDFARNVLLYLYALLGIFLVVYFICRKFNRISYWIPIVFIFFSGLDAIPNYFLKDNIDFVSHMEWWSLLFQYSSNTTQLFWVFNQSIPIWLIVILMLQRTNNKYILGFVAFAFACSPWATMGIIPLVIVAVLKKYSIKNLVNVFNIIVPVILLVFLGSFYTSGEGAKGQFGPLFYVYNLDIRYVLVLYFIFIIFEFLVYFVVMGYHAYKNELYCVTLLELLIIPLFIVRDYNFIMRASIPALFILMLYVMQFFMNDFNHQKSYEIRKYILFAIFLIGCITPIHEINRVVENTLIQTEWLREDYYSYADIHTNDVFHIELIRDQFFVYDYKEKPFYKYFAR